MIIYFLFFFLILYINVLATGEGYNKVRNLTYSFILLAVFVGVFDILGGYDRYIYGELFQCLQYKDIKEAIFFSKNNNC